MLDRPASHAHDMFTCRTWRTFRRTTVRRRRATAALNQRDSPALKTGNVVWITAPSPQQPGPIGI